MTQRSPICTVVGHVDHGKSSILDRIRGSAIVKSEAGGITQAIGASIIPMGIISKICGRLLDKTKINLTIPGILFIDTPGHAAFTNLRKRGGNLADIAILVVDINEGFKPQTAESVEILKSYKTPFIVAANKIDLIPGFKSNPESPLLQNIKDQDEETNIIFETKLYEIVGALDKFGLASDRFDRVEDYSKQIAIIPCSAKKGDGTAELLMVLAGLAQRFLGDQIEMKSVFARGTVLEVKDEPGLGKTLDVIIYDGVLKVNDTIVIGGVNKPIVAKVRALFEPAKLAEIRDKKAKFKSVNEAAAATGVKVNATGIDDVIAGMPLRSATTDDIEIAKEEVQKEVDEVVIETDKDGVVIKADTIGSLEALMTLLKDKGIPVRRAGVGNITKKDMIDAETNVETNPLFASILGFNISISSEVDTNKTRVKVFTNDVIYRLIEDFERWQEEKEKEEELKGLALLIRPAKIQIMPGYVFRQSNPAVVGCDVLEGNIKTGMPLMNKDGKTVTSIKGIQLEKENVAQAERGKQVAVSLDKIIIGRQAKEGEILYSAMSEDDFRKIKGFKKYLTPNEIVLLKEIAEIKRKDNPVWGI